ncbi:MAG: hypothetical protein AAF462_05655, partial [Thermodesulfobacteriota bacterium]
PTPLKANIFPSFTLQLGKQTKFEYADFKGITVRKIKTAKKYKALLLNATLWLFILHLLDKF